MLWILFLKKAGADFPGTYMEYLKDMTNLIPFKNTYILITTPIISSSVLFSYLRITLGNILLFVPYGCLWVLWQINSSKSLSFFKITITSIITIEIFQITLMLGCFDVNDILLDMLGAWIGYRISNKLISTI